MFQRVMDMIQQMATATGEQSLAAEQISKNVEHISSVTNDTASAKQDLNTHGGSVTWNWKNEIVEGEYIYSEVGNTKRAGWHIWAGHSFVTNARFLPEVQLVARYEQLDTDLDVGNNKVDRITIGTNLYIDKKYTKIQFNYQINGEEDTSIDNNEFWANFQVAF